MSFTNHSPIFSPVRIDKFLWSVRLFKTRSLSAKACNGDKVTLNEHQVKAGKTVARADRFAVKEKAVWRTYTVLDLPKSRVGAKLVRQFITETTPEEELQKLADIKAANRQSAFYGQKGRPTKKRRRDMDELLD